MGFFDSFKTTKQQKQVQDLVDSLTNEVTYRVTTKLQDEFIALQEVESATQSVIELKKQIATLNAEKENIVEGFARKEREVEHKTGLLRQEIEAEQRQSVKDFELRVQEAKLAAKEASLVERQKAFDDKMTFIEKRFTEEVSYLKEIVTDMSNRLPDASILATKVL